MPSSGEEGELPLESSLSAGERVFSSGKPVSCLPGRVHSLPVKECYLLGKPGNCLSGNCLPGDCLPGRVHSLPRERVLSTREAWDLPAWESTLSASERVLSTREAWDLPAWESAHSLPVRKSAIYWGSLGTACLGEMALGKSSFSWGRLRCLRGSTKI